MNLDITSSTVDRSSTLGNHHLTVTGPEMTVFVEEPLSLMFLDNIHHLSSISAGIDPSSLSSTPLSLVTRLTGVPRLVV